MKKILLGMSGGVDSTVAAILLQKQGFEVIGCTMKLCEQKNEIEQEAKKICKELHIEHHTLDYKKQFKDKVIDTFVQEYENARTPNPCVECNKYMKFGLLYNKARELNCKYIATGHYAKVEYSEKYNQHVIMKCNEEKKDQTYFLYAMPKAKLPYIIFPLQNLKNKQDTRKIAEKMGLNVATKKDSQEICFIPNDDYKLFLNKYIKRQSGNIVLKNGEILGKHNGIINYTIGQRKGLGISYKEPLYVLDLDVQKKEVIVGKEKELYKKELYAKDLNWLIFDELRDEMDVYAKIRYRATEARARLIPISNEIVKVEFEEPQRAITKGQSVVFYIDNVLIGGGKII